MKTLSDDITKDAILSSGWEEVIAGCAEKECYQYRQHFDAKIREAQETGDAKTQQIFSLFSDVTSMRLNLDKPEEPFEPMVVFHDCRSAMLDDFDASRLKLLNEVVTEISDAELRARIADVLWFCRRDFRLTGIAIPAYLESATLLQDPENWPATVDRMDRALQLAVMSGKNSALFKSVITHIETVLDTYDGEDPYFLSARLMQLLQDVQEGEKEKNAARAEKMALRAEGGRDWERSRQYWQIVAKWHSLNKDKEQAHRAKVREAETYVQQAESFVTVEHPSYMHASAFMEFAIQAMRKAGNMKERVAALHETLLDYQQKSVSELVPISSSVELDGNIVQAFIDQTVKGKSLPEAIMSLATALPLQKVSELKAKAQEDNEKYLMKRLFPNSYLNAMGRKIAKQPKDADEALLMDMFHNASFFRGVRIQAFIEPARLQINFEHWIRVRDFLPFLVNNPFVRPGREMVIARGLRAGQAGDFLTAVHFLIPQIEDSVRLLLTYKKVITSGLDEEGLQDEYNLNRMLSTADYSVPLAEILGEDFVFDLRGLLVEQAGANLRNDMAHGLIEHDRFYSEAGCYLWWLAMRFYSLPIVAKLQWEQEDQPQEESGSEDELQD